MTHRRSIRGLFVGLLLPLVTSACAGTMMSSTKGKVSDGNYYSPLGNFVMPLHAGMFGPPRINDSLDTEGKGGVVSALDDTGANRGVTYQPLDGAAGSAPVDPEKQDLIYRSFVFDYVLPNYYKPVSPHARVVHEEYLDSGPGRAFFAIAVIPGASSMMDGKTGARLDSIRALLVFQRGAFIYMLHQEMNTSFGRVSADAISEKEVADNKKGVKALRESIRFQ